MTQSYRVGIGAEPVALIAEPVGCALRRVFVAVEGQGEAGTPYVWIGGEDLSSANGYAYGEIPALGTSGIEMRGQLYAMADPGSSPSSGYLRILLVEVS